jgi:hypothetical protein
MWKHTRSIIVDHYAERRSWGGYFVTDHAAERIIERFIKNHEYYYLKETYWRPYTLKNYFNKTVVILKEDFLKHKKWIEKRWDKYVVTWKHWMYHINEKNDTILTVINLFRS